MKPTQLLVIVMWTGVTLMAGVGCNAATDQDPTPVTHFKITPAPGSLATTRPAATPTVRSTPASAGQAAVSISAKNSNLKFDKDSLTATAGSVTITFNNADSGIPHNFHLFAGSDAKGESLGQTDLVSGPVEQTLKLDLVAGTYHFQCDAHPITMKGTLTVG